MTRPTSSDLETVETKRQNFNITPEQEAQLNWLREAINAPNIKETILRSIEVMLTLKRHMRPGNQLFLHTKQGQVRLLIPSYLSIVKSIANLETSGYSLANQFISLNQWNY